MCAFAYWLYKGSRTYWKWTGKLKQQSLSQWVRLSFNELGPSFFILLLSAFGLFSSILYCVKCKGPIVVSALYVSMKMWSFNNNACIYYSQILPWYMEANNWSMSDFVDWLVRSEEWFSSNSSSNSSKMLTPQPFSNLHSCMLAFMASSS